jgi:ribonuclease III family protein
MKGVFPNHMDMNKTIEAFIASHADGGAANQQVESLAPLTLAYLGDALFELFVRDYLIQQPQTSVHRVHQRTITYVNAASQAVMVRHLLPLLTEREADVVRRGRNGKAGSIPRNADVAEYRYATGFEALLGWLYCQNETSRLLEVMGKAVALLEMARMEESKPHEAI